MLSWMYWTYQSLIGFGLLFGMLFVVTMIDLKNPSYPTKGFLPMETTRGDRVFLSVATFLLMVLIWLKYAPDLTPWVVVAAGIINAAIIFKWG